MAGLWLSGRVKVYIDLADWWIGLYIGPNHLYFCCLTLVCRIRRRKPREIEVPGGLLTIPAKISEEQVEEIIARFENARGERHE